MNNYAMCKILPPLGCLERWDGQKLVAQVGPSAVTWAHMENTNNRERKEMTQTNLREPTDKQIRRGERIYKESVFVGLRPSQEGLGAEKTERSTWDTKRSAAWFMAFTRPLPGGERAGSRPAGSFSVP